MRSLATHRIRAVLRKDSGVRRFCSLLNDNWQSAVLPCEALATCFKIGIDHEIIRWLLVADDLVLHPPARRSGRRNYAGLRWLCGSHGCPYMHACFRDIVSLALLSLQVPRYRQLGRRFGHLLYLSDTKSTEEQSEAIASQQQWQLASCWHRVANSVASRRTMTLVYYVDHVDMIPANVDAPTTHAEGSSCMLPSALASSRPLFSFNFHLFISLSALQLLAQQIAIKAHIQTWPRVTVLYIQFWEKVPGHQCSSLQAEKRCHRSISLSTSAPPSPSSITHHRLHSLRTASLLDIVPGLKSVARCLRETRI